MSPPHSKVPPNIILFGSTGSGKSSIVNMVAQKDIAQTSNGAVGCTFQHDRYDVSIQGATFRLWDTIGLNEGFGGTVQSRPALESLYKLIRNLEGGVSLLVFCMRGPRITENAKKNYSVFYDGLCQRKVPIAILVTGLEELENMEGWWDSNSKHFKNYDMLFDGHGCITASRGKKMNDGTFKNQMEYDESQKVVTKLFVDCCSKAGEPWKMISATWFGNVVRWLYERTEFRVLWNYLPSRVKSLFDIFKEIMPEEEARKAACTADRT